MGYCTRTYVERILAQALTTGSPRSLDSTVDLLQIGNVIDSNVIPTSTVDQYIQWGDAIIDGYISQLYVTPLCERSNFETRLLANINEYNDYIIATNTCPFYPGDKLVLTDGENTERVVIESVVDNDERNVFVTETPIQYTWDAITTRILRIEYPDPIPLTSARLAAASVYEKYFMSQTSPSTSEYGKFLRQQARADLNNILNGRTILHGQKRIGRRFYNPNLAERYDLPESQAGNNNIDELS